MKRRLLQAACEQVSSYEADKEVRLRSVCEYVKKAITGIGTLVQKAIEARTCEDEPRSQRAPRDAAGARNLDASSRTPRRRTHPGILETRSPLQPVPWTLTTRLMENNACWLHLLLSPFLTMTYVTYRNSTSGANRSRISGTSKYIGLVAVRSQTGLGLSLSDGVCKRTHLAMVDAQ